MNGGTPLVFNQDFTVNSPENPAKVGSYATIFATGLGPIDPPQPDGSVIEFPLPANVLQSFMYWNQSGWIGPPIQQNVTLQYVGPAPFRVAGVSQINILVEDTGYRPLTVRVLVPVPAPAESDVANSFSIYVAPQ